MMLGLKNMKKEVNKKMKINREIPSVNEIKDELKKIDFLIKIRKISAKVRLNKDEKKVFNQLIRLGINSILEISKNGVSLCQE